MFSEFDRVFSLNLNEFELFILFFFIKKYQQDFSEYCNCAFPTGPFLIQDILDRLDDLDK